MQRIWGAWEAIAAPFVLDTPLINLVYILLGADVSRNPKLWSLIPASLTRNPKP